MSDAVRKWYRKLRPEDPRRMHEFRDMVQALEWTPQASLASLRCLHCAVDCLAEAEVRYYYRRRATRALLSGTFRLTAWACGTIGLLLPLLAATSNPNFRESGQYGYPFLAIAASVLGANSLFGGTAGHVRFVSTQLAIEKLITTSRVEWAQYRSVAEGSGVSEAVLKEGFSLVSDYATALYTTTISETGHWAEMLVAELSKFQKSVDDLGKARGRGG